MKSNNLFPRTAAFPRLCAALLLVLTIASSSLVVLATDGPKPASAARPVARLLSTTTSRQEVPARTRARLVARVTSAPTTYAPTSYVSPVPARAAVAAATTMAASGDERRAFDLINAERRARGHQPLVWDAQLMQMARYHSQNMASAGVLNHVDRAGLDLTGRASLLGLRGWRALGENIAYNQGYADPVAFVVERWMVSEKHRENILNGQFTHAGLGIARAADGRIFFTQVFMTR